MKALIFLLAIALSIPLSAQGRVTEGVGRILLFGEAIQTQGILLGQGIKDQADRQTGFGLRLQLNMAGESPWFGELSARFQSGAAMSTNRDISSVPPANILNVTKVQVDYSYWAVGAAYLIPLGASGGFGVHIEGRAETINPKGSYSTTNGGTAQIDAMTVYFRPWVRLSLEGRIKTGSLLTLIGADLGVAATKASQRSIVPMSQMDAPTLRALAPTWSGALYAGVQF